MNCCNSFGQCTQGQDCAIRGCSQSKGRDNVQSWVNSVNTPPNYMPKIMPVKQSYWHELCDYFADGWRHVALGMAIGALLLLVILWNFQPLWN